MTQRLRVKSPAVICASGTHTYLKINQLQVSNENVLLLISKTGISAVEDNLITFQYSKVQCIMRFGFETQR
jgi:hypothetical protein